MKLPLLACAMTALIPALASAQHTATNDDGTPVANVHTGYTGIQAAGSLTTTFASNNQFAGNMIDIAPVTDMEITGIDMNIVSVGNTCDIDVWYIAGTSVGFEASSAGWVYLGAFTGTTAGTDLPTFIDMAGNGMTFSGGQTYGLYFDCVSYGNGDTVRYTNGSGAGGGPNGEDQWSNADLTITANCGKGSGGHTGSTFRPRNWNGTIYYETGGFNLSVSSLQSNAMTTVATSGGVSGSAVIVGYSFAGGGPTNTPFGVADLTPPIFKLPTEIADGSGNTSAMYNIPGGVAGRTIYIQAVNILGPGNGVFSNQVSGTIL
jgi:hypothetical protein